MTATYVYHTNVLQESQELVTSLVQDASAPPVSSISSQPITAASHKVSRKRAYHTHYL